MLIYLNGDSFSAGVCLADFLLPEYPGNFNDAELISKSKEIKKFANTKAKYAAMFVDYDILQSENCFQIEFHNKRKKGRVDWFSHNNILEKKLAYPAHLEKIDQSIKTINASVAGASIGGICYRTTIDLLNLKAKGIKVDRIIIQLTSPGRYEFFDHKAPAFILDRPMHCFRTDQENKIAELISLKYTNEDMLIKYMYHVSTLKELAISITGRPPLFIDSMNGTLTSSHFYRLEADIRTKNPTDLSYFNDLKDHSMMSSWNIDFMSDCAKLVDKPYEHDGHYQIEVHKLVAQRLYDIL